MSEPESTPDPVLRREAIHCLRDHRAAPAIAATAAVGALAGTVVGFALALLAQPRHECSAVPAKFIERSTVPVDAHSPVAVHALSAPQELGWLGVQVVPGHPPGALVIDIVSGTPAERADLRTGDHITGLADVPIRSTHDLVREVSSRSPGEQVKVTLERDGKPVEVIAQLAVMPQWLQSYRGHVVAPRFQPSPQSQDCAAGNATRVAPVDE